MANISLKALFEAESFTAINKETGKTSVFKSKDSRDSAVKAGTHSAVKDPKAGGKAKSGVNIFDKPAAEKPIDTDADAEKAADPTADAKANNVIKGLKPAKSPSGKYPDSLEYGGSLYRINKKGQAVRDREVRVKDITPEDITTTEKLFGVDLSKGMENGMEDDVADLIVQTKRLQQFQKGGEFENQKAYDSLLDNIKSGVAKNFNKKIQAAEKKKASAAKYPNKSDDPSYWKDSKKYYDEEDDVEKTADRLDKVETALEDELNLRGNGFETTRESGGGMGGWEGPMTIVSKDADYDSDEYISLSVGSPNNDGKFSIVFANANGEPYFEPDYDALTGDTDLEPQQIHKITKALMQMPEVQKLLKGEMTIDEFKPIYDKLKSKFSKTKKESTKLTSMIKK